MEFLPEQYLLLCKNKRVYCVYTRIVSIKDVPRCTKKNVGKGVPKSTKQKVGKLIKNVKILVHAQDSRACTTLLCMHNTLVHAQEPGLGPKKCAGPVPGPELRPF